MRESKIRESENERTEYNVKHYDGHMEEQGSEDRH